MIVSRRSALQSSASQPIMRGAAMANARSEARAMEALGHNEASARFRKLMAETGAKP